MVELIIKTAITTFDILLMLIVLLAFGKNRANDTKLSACFMFFLFAFVNIFGMWY